jgi:hypothetical protein
MYGLTPTQKEVRPMADSADTTAENTAQAIERIRKLVAEHAPGLSADVDLLETAIEQRDALKEAGDAMIYEISHPKRRGSHMMETLVAFRRVSEEMDR